MITAIAWGVQESEITRVAVVDELNPTFSKLKSSKQIMYDYNIFGNDDIAFAKSRFKEGNFHTAILYLPKNLIETRGMTGVLIFKKQPSAKVVIDIERQVQRLFRDYLVDIVVKEQSELGSKLDPEVFERVNVSLRLTQSRIKADGSFETIDPLKGGIGFALGLIIYMFIFMYGIQVMRGVIEEKSNRIIEIIVSSVKPFQLMMGKIIGIAMVGLTQFLLWVIFTGLIFVIASTVLFYQDMNPADIVENSQVTGEMMDQLQHEGLAGGDANEIYQRLMNINFGLIIGMFIFYFLGGYLLYSALFAAVGAAVDSETDTQQFVLPITIPLVFAYVMSIFVIANPQGPAAFWLSIIPFTSPIVMMVRIVMGIDAGDIWHIYLSMALLVLGFLFTTWMAARIYRTGILMYGKKVTYKELWKWLTYKG